MNTPKIPSPGRNPLPETNPSLETSLSSHRRTHKSSRPSEHPRQTPRPPVRIMSTFYPSSPPIKEMLDQFWQLGTGFEEIRTHLSPPAAPLELLEKLGPSPFAKGDFPLIGFLATTYDKVSQATLAGVVHEE